MMHYIAPKFLLGASFMRLDNVLTHFNTNKAGLARIMGVCPSAVGKWSPALPLDKAALIEKRTYGGLRIDWDCYDEGGRVKKTEGA